MIYQAETNEVSFSTFFEKEKQLRAFFVAIAALSLILNSELATAEQTLDDKRRATELNQTILEAQEEIADYNIFIEKEFNAQKVDLSWSRKVSTLIEQLLESQDRRVVLVGSAQCRSTLCRLEFRSDESSVRLLAPITTTEFSSNFSGSFIARAGEGDDNDTFIVYFVRRGHELP